MQKLFDSFGMEENFDGTVSTAVSVCDVVALESDHDDIMAEAAEIQGQIIGMEVATDVADNIDGLVALEEAALESGSATADYARLALAALSGNMKALGMEEDNSISNESIDSNPDAAVKISIESAKETFQNIIKKIKEFFQRIWSKIKIMAGKIMLWVGNYEKRFQSLAKEVDNLKDETKDGVKDKFTESESKAIVKKFFTTAALGVGAGIVSNKKYGKEFFKQQAHFLENVIDSMDDYKGVKDNAGKTLAAFNELNKLYNGLPSGTELSGAVVSRIDGSTVKGIAIKVVEVEIGENKYPKVTFSSFTGSAKPDLIANSKEVPIIPISELKTSCANGLSLAKESDSYKKYSEELLKKTEKAIGKTPKSKKEGEQDRLNTLYASSLNSVNTNALKFSSDVLLGYVGTLKNSAAVISLGISKYKTKN